MVLETAAWLDIDEELAAYGIVRIVIFIMDKHRNCTQKGDRDD
jgi:hypothetical protein